MDHPLVELMGQKLGPIYGIVGFPFFARYTMTVDYQAQTLTFVPNGYDPPDVMKTIMDTVMAMAGDKPRPPKVLTPAAQWGVLLDKDDKDLDEGVTIQEVLPGSAAAQVMAPRSSPASVKPTPGRLIASRRTTSRIASASARSLLRNFSRAGVA